MKFDIDFNSVKGGSIIDGIQNELSGFDLMEAYNTNHFDIAISNFELIHENILYQKYILEALYNSNNDDELFKSELCIMQEGFIENFHNKLMEAYNAFLKMLDIIQKAITRIINSIIKKVKSGFKDDTVFEQPVIVKLYSMEPEQGITESANKKINLKYIFFTKELSDLQHSITRNHDYLMESALHDSVNPLFQTILTQFVNDVDRFSTLTNEYKQSPPDMEIVLHKSSDVLGMINWLEDVANGLKNSSAIIQDRIKICRSCRFDIKDNTNIDTDKFKYVSRIKGLWIEYLNNVVVLLDTRKTFCVNNISILNAVKSSATAKNK